MILEIRATFNMATKFDLDKMYCAHIKRGDVLVVHHEDEKEGLMVVVQENILNERLSTVLGVPLEIHKVGRVVHKNEILLKAKETNLGKDAVCLPHKMIPYDRRHLVSKKAELPADRLKDLYATIDINFGRFRDKPIVIN